jgi:hypothetical protein
MSGMEAKDVLLLLAGSILGFVTSLLATFTAPSIGNAFGKLRCGFIERNKSKALASYAQVRNLKSGAWDKYLYALNSWGFVMVHLVFFAVCTTVGLLHTDPTIRLAGGIGAVVGPVLSLRRLSIMLITLTRVAHFDDYRAELLQRWPDLVLPE